MAGAKARVITSTIKPIKRGNIDLRSISFSFALFPAGLFYVYITLGQGMQTPENNLITVFTAKEVTLLFKTFLEILEDVRTDNTAMLAKVSSETSPKFASDINYFTPEKYEQLRKRILDMGNESSRRLIQFLDFFDFTINKEKVEEAAKQKRQVFKKFVTGGTVMLE